MKKTLLAIFSILLMIALTACGGNGGSDKNEEGKTTPEANTAAKKQVLKIGAIPDQNASDLNRSFGAMAEYLSEKTGLEVEYVPSVDYAALITAFQRGEIQLGWFGGLTGVQVRNVVPEAEAIVQRPRDEQFHSVFIAQNDLQIDSLDDLKGLSFTFGSESSTSGHLMPRYFMEEAGINPNQDLDGMPNYSGSHDKTYKLVESGAFQTGALNEAVWETAVAEGKVDVNKVKVFYTTPPYYDYHWVVGNVDEVYGEGTKDKLKEALLSMNEEQKDILDLFATDKFIETKNENYAAIEKVAKELGIIK
ncbi:putative selenate ABC transporter substrate-binding protein [Schinkia azotoformans]|uniref:Phosphate/phosphonate ABC transport system periplasmic phosphonate-binding protein n=1 Tax=Schinkia azotoformans LMG 9581 TaxID=1131731 RepID=K6D591_SCHAZ|nr:putative selenate ABC transporter substrate-binding protein [Schinkia azotoformans]EKN63213.1 phosphate/phosphonate ABC transport system periplasmic phosphonate-binding protein [Schinkia azotoformans LMG 9581]MEC1637235.1 putative selenate ABC transporter substrate-binding protein [Schinkia azotoformans]MEC1943639.1 putative selenate ABC transporter substrate-binding protein [Schinkia azotoformans]MED4352369.1 putative selenate ABC transporter substrate-binding protein [Schinkia azotoformans